MPNQRCPWQVYRKVCSFGTDRKETMSVKPNNVPGRLMSSPLGGWGLGMVPRHEPQSGLSTPTSEARS
jgi:hypothetical protein